MRTRQSPTASDTIDALVPTDEQLVYHRICPTHSLARPRYIVTASGTTSACARNDLGARSASNYLGDVEASDCYAYDTQVANNNAFYETRIPSGAVPIKKVYMSWRDQGPHLLCEWAVLKQIEPVYNLYYPQFERFVDNTFDTLVDGEVQAGNTYRYGAFSLPAPFASTVRKINALRINEVPSLIVIRCELAERSRNRFEWMDIRAYISNVKFQLNERPDLTSNVPDIVGYRWFLENTKTLMSFEEWKSNCLWVISPQQLAVDSATFVESLARVNTMSLEVTVRRPKAYKNALQQYRNSDFWPAQKSTYDDAKIYATPPFQVRVDFVYDNHSLSLNSQRQVILRKNTIQSKAPTGLVRDDRGLPKMKGLLAGGPAASSGAKAVGGARTY